MPPASAHAAPAKAPVDMRKSAAFGAAQDAAVDSLVAMARANQRVLERIVENDGVQKALKDQWHEVQREAFGGESRDAEALGSQHAALEAANHFSMLAEYFKYQYYAHGAACAEAAYAAYTDELARDANNLSGLGADWNVPACGLVLDQQMQ